jgi:formylglycine-generating enzyme required for sulfatase activity
MRTEVAAATFADLFSKTGLRLPRQPSWSEGGRHPVVNVTWDEARLFCERAFRGRLPTEAEWEYAARGGTADDKYTWGNTYDASMVNGVSGVRTRDRWAHTSPAGSFPPTGRGLFDMLGNVWEWTSDVYIASFYSRSPAEDPVGRGAGLLRSLRGGSWDIEPRRLRLSVRAGLSIRSRFPLYVGFRCAADGPGAPPPVNAPPAISETRR